MSSFTPSPLTDFAFPWIPDQGDGTFRNPILHADYSDPDVIRVGDDYWMTASSFTCTPALPILHSRDLVNWKLVNHAVQQVPHPKYESAVCAGSGIWAPSIRYHAGLFWIFFPMPDEGIYVTTAERPDGKWSEPWCLQEAKGWIDPCPFWDDDGTAWLFHAFAKSRAGKCDRLHARPMSPDGKRLLGEGQEIVFAPQHPYLEGPKLHKFDGVYYVLAPGGGVPQGWQVVFRSNHILGPYEEKVVLEKGSTDINGPHQGALIDTPAGDWWFIHFQDANAFGRITHLQPVQWKDGWPEMGVDYDSNGVGEPVVGWKKPLNVAGERCGVDGSDEFETATLRLDWQWQGNHDPAWVDFSTRPGWLRLEARPSSTASIEKLPHFVGQKFPARTFEVTTLLEASGTMPGDLAGLGVTGGNGSAGIAVQRTEAGIDVVRLLNGEVTRLGALNGTSVRFKVRVGTDATCTFFFATETGPFAQAGEPFFVTEGGWVGARVGLFSAQLAAGSQPGAAEFDYFRFAAPTSIG